MLLVLFCCSVASSVGVGTVVKDTAAVAANLKVDVVATATAAAATGATALEDAVVVQ